MKIGNIEIDSRTASLAPMAGVADRAFRELCVGYGASYVVSEMVSSKGLTMCDRKSKKLLQLSEKEMPAAAEIPSMISPLAITGMSTLFFTSAIIFLSTDGAYIC